MSWHAMDWALEAGECAKVSPTCRLVLVILAQYAKQDGTSVYPSKRTVAKRAGVNIRQMHNILSELQAVGLIEKTAKTAVGKPVDWRLVRDWEPDPGSQLPRSPAVEGADDDVDLCNQLPRGVGSQLPGGRQSIARAPRQLTADEEIKEQVSEEIRATSHGEVLRAGATRVFDAWVEGRAELARRTARRVGTVSLDSKRMNLIKRALSDYPIDEVLDAVRGWLNSPYHCGRNDQRKVYNDLDLLLRDASHIERFRDYHRDDPSTPIRPADEPPMTGSGPRRAAILQNPCGEKPKPEAPTEATLLCDNVIQNPHVEKSA